MSTLCFMNQIIIHKGKWLPVALNSARDRIKFSAIQFGSKFRLSITSKLDLCLCTSLFSLYLLN